MKYANVHDHGIFYPFILVMVTVDLECPSMPKDDILPSLPSENILNIIKFIWYFLL